MSLYCPECGRHIRRSHARGFGERIVRALTRYRPYRCRGCGWRGWFSGAPRPYKNLRGTIQTVISALALIIIVLLVFYMTALD
jgi:hypothetical protein